MSVASDRRWMERLVASGGEGSRIWLRDNRLDVDSAAESGDGMVFRSEVDCMSVPSNRRRLRG